MKKKHIRVQGDAKQPYVSAKIELSLVYSYPFRPPLQAARHLPFSTDSPFLSPKPIFS